MSQKKHFVLFFADWVVVVVVVLGFSMPGVPTGNTYCCYYCSYQ